VWKKKAKAIGDRSWPRPGEDCRRVRVLEPNHSFSHSSSAFPCGESSRDLSSVKFQPLTETKVASRKMFRSRAVRASVFCVQSPQVQSIAMQKRIHASRLDRIRSGIFPIPSSVFSRQSMKPSLTSICVLQPSETQLLFAFSSRYRNIQHH
jgi:hypothetical protein